MKKRILSLALATVMAVSVFAGCSKKKDEPAKVEPAPAASSENKGPYAPEKDLKVTIWSTQDTDFIATEVPSENIVQNWLKGKTKVEVENIFGNGGGSEQAKLPQLLAADNIPELIRGRLDLQRKLIEADKAWELTEEMIKTYAPNIWEKVPGYTWDKIKIDGKLYSIPFYFPTSKRVDPSIPDRVVDLFDIPPSQRTFVNHSSPWVRDDILKKIYPEAKTYDELVKLLDEKKEPIGDLMLDVPIKSTHDYIDFMYKIKDLKLTEGNKPVHAFGFNGGDNWMALSFFGPELVGSRYHYYTGSWDPINKKIRLPLIEDNDKEMALIMNRMIRDSVIEPESLVHTQAQFDAKAMNGLYAIILPSYVQGGDTIKLNAELKKAGKNYQYRPLMTQYDNKKEYPVFYEVPEPFAYMVITKTVKEQDVPQLLNWINTQYTDEFEDVYYWGPKEAGLYEELPDGTRKFKDPKAQKFFVENDQSESKLADFKGIGNEGCTLYTRFMGASKYHPLVVTKSDRFEPTRVSGFKFKASSTHITSVQMFPPCQGWSAPFSGIPEVQKFWEVRQQWEDPFKLVFAAKSDEDFEQKWDKAVKNLKSLVDIDSMLNQMTEIARKEADKLGIK